LTIEHVDVSKSNILRNKVIDVWMMVNQIFISIFPSS